MRTEKLNAQADMISDLRDRNETQATMLSDTLTTALGNSMDDLFKVHGASYM